MNSEPTIDQVEQAVRAVLAGRARPAGAKSGASRFAYFGGPLLSVKAVELLGELGPELSISPETVVTPLARDLLKKRRVSLRWISRADRLALSPPGEWGFACEVQSTTTDLFARRLLVDPEPWHALAGSTPEAAGWAASAPGRGVIVLTSQASVAVWIASRFEGVRPAAPTTAEAVSRATEALGANFLAFEPAAHPPAELLSFARILRRAGAPAIPPTLAEGAAAHEDRRGHWPGDALASAPQSPQRQAPDRPPDDARGAHRGLVEAWRGSRRL